MQATGIAYLTHTWNPIAMRCTPVSEGCAHCWHLEVASRHSRNPVFPAYRRIANSGRSAPLLLDGEKGFANELARPARRKKPAVIGVQFMGDLWHERIADDWIDRVVAQIVAAPQHLFVTLTKRVNRAQLYWQARTVPPNALMGTSVETQELADERVPALLGIDGRRWLSVEPLLGPVDLSQALGGAPLSSIEFVTAGCEKPPFRASQDDWFRSLRDECATSDVAFDLKQAVRHKAVLTHPLLDGRQHKKIPHA